MFAIYILGYVIGYLLLAIITTYVVVKVAGKRGVTKRKKIIAAIVTLFIFWLIPFWDWIPTVIYHKYLCNTEAGVKINRSVEGVEGFLGEGPWALSVGYRYGYGNNQLGGYVRFRSNPDKSSFKPWIEEPAPETPLYGIRHETIPLEMHEGKKQQIIYVVSTGEVLATLVDFNVRTTYPYGSLFEIRKAFWPFCRPCFWDGDTSLRLQKEMILKTLKPIEVNN